MKKMLLPMLALGLLASCSENADEPQPQANPNEITATMSTLDITTRAPYAGTISAGNPLLARVVATQTQGNYTTEYQGAEAGYMNFTSDGNTGFCLETGSASPKFYPSDASATIYMAGLYPAADWTVAASTATHAIDGKTDIMAAPETSSVKGGAVGNLAFTHKLTQIKVQFQVEDENAADGWGTINSITLTGVNNSNTTAPANSVSIALADASATFSGNAATSFYGFDGTNFTDVTFAATPLTAEMTTPKAVAYTLCQPLTAEQVTSANDYYITVTNTTGTSRTVAVDLKNVDDTSSFTDATAGVAFTVTLNFRATEILATASVTDWVQGGNTTVVVE